MIVLLHGFAGTPAAWDDVIAAWPADAPVLAGELVALPLPGHGAPDAPSWEAALDQLEARIAAVAGGEPAAVVGYSLGARLALGLLARDAAPRAVLVSGHPGLPDDPAVRAARRADDARWAARLRDLGTAAFLDAWEAQPLLAGAARVDPARRARRRAARERLAPEPLARSLETVGLAEMPDLRAALAARAARARLVVGADDARFVALARAAAAAAPALAVETAPDAGHDLTLEAPAWLAAAIARATGTSPAAPAG